MDSYVIISAAVIFTLFGGWLGHRIGFDKGRDEALRVAGAQIRQLSQQMNLQEAQADKDKRGIEAQLREYRDDNKLLEDQLKEARAKNDKLSKQLIETENKHQALLGVVRKVAASRSRDAIFWLRDALSEES